MFDLETLILKKNRNSIYALDILLIYDWLVILLEFLRFEMTVWQVFRKSQVLCVFMYRDEKILWDLNFDKLICKCCLLCRCWKFWRLSLKHHCCLPTLLEKEMHDLLPPNFLYNSKGFLVIPILATYLCNTVVEVIGVLGVNLWLLFERLTSLIPNLLLFSGNQSFLK
jgi:hypothetical protein